MQDRFPIDDHFRDRLGRSEVAPPPAVWEAVEAELARKRRRLVGFWLTGGLASVGLLAAVWLAYSPGKAGEVSQNSGGQNAVASTGVAASEASSFEKKPAGISGEASASMTESTGQTSIEKAAEISTVAPAATGGVKPASQFRSKYSTPIPAVAAPLLFEKPSAAPVDFTQTSPAGDPLATTEISAQNIESQSVRIGLEKENLTATDKPTSFSLKNLAPLDGRGTVFLKNNRPSKNPPIRRFKTKKWKPSCPSFADRGEVFYVDLYAGAGPTFHRLSDKGGDTPGYVQRRKETEKQVMNWNVGARAGWLWAGHFALRAGLNYTQVEERLDFYDPKLLQTIIYIDEQTGERDTAHVVEHIVRKNNHLGLLDLPVTIGFEQNRGHFGYSLNGGVAMNLLFWRGGKIVDPSNDGQPARRRSSLRANAGLSAMANAQVFYQIDRKSRLFIEPTYQRVLRPVSRKSHPAEERYTFGSVSVGFTRLLK